MARWESHTHCICLVKTGGSSMSARTWSRAVASWHCRRQSKPSIAYIHDQWEYRNSSNTAYNVVRTNCQGWLIQPARKFLIMLRINHLYFYIRTEDCVSNFTSPTLFRSTSIGFSVGMILLADVFFINVIKILPCHDRKILTSWTDQIT